MYANELQISINKTSKTRPNTVKKKLMEERKQTKPRHPMAIEIRKMFLLPNLSDNTLATKYRRPPTKMIMQMATFFKYSRSQ
jgi:hypothetical protein